MKLGILLVLSSAIIGSTSFAQSVKPFGTPLASLQKGTVHFLCRQVGDTELGGSNLMQFDLSLGPAKIDPDLKIVLEQYPLVISNTQLGTLSGGGPQPLTSSYYPIGMDLSAQNVSVGGQVLFTGGQYERIEFGGSQQTEMTGMYAGYTEQLRFGITQDISSKLVFSHYQRTVVKDGTVACKDFSQPCLPTQATPENYVMLCEPQL